MPQCRDIMASAIEMSCALSQVHNRVRAFSNHSPTDEDLGTSLNTVEDQFGAGLERHGLETGAMTKNQGYDDEQIYMKSGRKTEGVDEGEFADKSGQEKSNIVDELIDNIDGQESEEILKEFLEQSLKWGERVEYVKNNDEEGGDHLQYIIDEMNLETETEMRSVSGNGLLEIVDRQPVGTLASFLLPIQRPSGR
uniref:Uncharacterized protein n=1 Tax=Spongospora subterranea TaxID=70186 RepID=A0A0H5RPU9_9EUKA|eukprot:CRZ10754.1 hypothetical protein [Spongospora subterranea]